MWKPTTYNPNALRHSQGPWEDHKYVKVVDGKYYYPNGYDNGRTISDLGETDKKSNDSDNDDSKTAKKSMYSKDDSDFDDKNYNDKNLLGDTDFYGFKNKDGKNVIVIEDKKWTLPEGAKLDSKLISRLEAVDKELEKRRQNGERIDSDEWDRLVQEAIDGTSSTKKSGSSKGKSSKSSKSKSSSDAKKSAAESKARIARNKAIIKKRTEEQQKAKKERMRKNMAQGKSYLNHSSIWAPSDYLYHTGTKGMRWGERRYQYSDGSLTPLGREHYGVGEPRGSNGNKWNSNSGKRNSSSMENNARSVKDIFNETGKITNNLGKMANRMNKKEKEKQKAQYHPDLSQMSDKELRKALERMQMEHDYKNFTMQYKKSGYEKTMEVLDVVGSVAAIGTSAATIYLACLKFGLVL